MEVAAGAGPDVGGHGVVAVRRARERSVETATSVRT